MKLKNIFRGSVLLTFLWIGCKETFMPPPVHAGASYLVVEGAINANGGSTAFTLSRTQSIRDTGSSSAGSPSPIYETGAQVIVENDQGDHFNLPEKSEGLYGEVSLPINEQGKYRLHIITGTGEEYLSSFVRAIPVPNLDSISWELQEDGVHIYFEAFGTGNVTKYYRWTYNETWEFHTPLVSHYKYRVSDSTLVRRLPIEQVQVCWTSDRSTNILLGNTDKLSNNHLSKATAAFIPLHSEKLSILYSLKLNLFSISKNEFEFWQRMKKNTEEMGTIFTPQPSTVRGNIKCVSNPKEPVIGYVGVENKRSKRIFIDNREMPRRWNLPNNQCEPFTIPNTKSSLAHYLNSGSLIPLRRDLLQGGYQIVSRRCADCTVRGTTQKPSFWP